MNHLICSWILWKACSHIGLSSPWLAIVFHSKFCRIFNCESEWQLHWRTFLYRDLYQENYGNVIFGFSIFWTSIWMDCPCNTFTSMYLRIFPKLMGFIWDIPLNEFKLCCHFVPIFEGVCSCDNDRMIWRSLGHPCSWIATVSVKKS